MAGTRPGMTDSSFELRAARLGLRGELGAVGVGNGDVEVVVGAAAEGETEIRIGRDRAGPLYVEHQLAAALHDHLVDVARRDDVGGVDVELHPVRIRVLDHY